MIAPSHEEMLGIAYFPGEQGQDHLNWKWSSVDEVPIKQVRVLLWGHAIQVKNVQQVVKLAMHIATDRYLLQVVDLNSC